MNQKIHIASTVILVIAVFILILFVSKISTELNEAKDDITETQEDITDTTEKLSTSRNTIEILESEKSDLTIANNDLSIENNTLLSENELLKQDKLEEESKHSERLEEIIKSYSDKKTMTYQEFYNLVMGRFAAIIKLQQFERNNGYLNPDNIYSINTEYTLEQGWYLVSGDEFEIELHGYETAKEVHFIYTKLETDMGPILLYKDTESSDGWKYSTSKIGEILEASEIDYTTWPPTYIIYAEIVMSDDEVINAPVLPIYNVAK